MTNSSNSWDLYSDTPQGGLNGVDNESYLTNVTKNTDSSQSSSKSSNTTSGSVTTDENGNDNLNSTEDYFETVSGFEGGSASELLLKYRETFLNIDIMILGNLEDLFFQIW